MMSSSTFEMIEGDCRAAMATMPADSVDAIVTDPPYGLAFMGKDWDGGIAQSVDLWREAFRVLKPGGHLVAFGGTRTSHRMVSAIEDAGFEIRDSVMWVYGSGFPKSHNIGKAIDKAAGAEREVVGLRTDGRGASPQKLENHGPGDTGIGHMDGSRQSYLETAPATDAAKQWEGWGTALKPAHEPICVARKPLIGTVAANVQAHGTGALNIDDCRVPTEGGSPSAQMRARARDTGNTPGRPGEYRETIEDRTSPERYIEERPGEALGRWPANVIHDGGEEVLDAFARFGERNGGHHPTARGKGNISTSGHAGQGGLIERHSDTGSAARFFYCAKASKADRDEGLADFAEQPYVQFQTANGTSGKPSSISEGRDTRYRNNHPTVKPTALMRYLCRLVTPPGGLILDPFAGSGSTGKAAIAEGFRFIGIESEPEYVAIARARLNAATTRGT